MIRFYYGSGSPYSWRVQLVLEEKGLAARRLAASEEAGDDGDGDARVHRHGSGAGGQRDRCISSKPGHPRAVSNRGSRRS
jgi:hypothetical protein